MGKKNPGRTAARASLGRESLGGRGECGQWRLGSAGMGQKPKCKHMEGAVAMKRNRMMARWDDSHEWDLSCLLVGRSDLNTFKCWR